MQNLGEKLAQAGVPGASPVSPSKQALLQEILGLASKQTSKSLPDEDRLKRLPAEFDSLRTITHGEDFMATFTTLCRANPTLINRDLVVIVCELAHKTRDELIAAGKGGRQKSFKKCAIPKLIALKNDMPHDSQQTAGFILNRLR